MIKIENGVVVIVFLGSGEVYGFIFIDIYIEDYLYNVICFLVIKN